MASSEGLDVPEDPWSFHRDTPAESVPPRLLLAFVAMLRSDEHATVFHGALMIHKLLSVHDDPPIQAAIDAGAVPLLVTCLADDDRPETQLEAVAAVSAVASSTDEHAKLVIQAGAVPQLIRLMASDDEKLREEATWAVGYIAGVSTECRDYVLSLGAMDRVVDVIRASLAQIDVLRNAAWTLSNLCRSQPAPALAFVLPVLPVLATLLHHTDDQIATDACWALSGACDESIQNIEAVAQANVIGKMVAMLSSTSVATQTPAVRAVGNIAGGGRDTHRQAVINSGALKPLCAMLRHSRRSIKKESAQCLAKICSTASVDEFQLLITAGAYPILLELVRGHDNDAQKEAVRCVTNTVARCSGAQREYLIKKEVVQALCHALIASDADTALLALTALHNLLRFGEEENAAKGLAGSPVVDLIVDCGGAAHIEALLEHVEAHELRCLSKAILKGWFDMNDDDDDDGKAGDHEETVAVEDTGFD